MRLYFGICGGFIFVIQQLVINHDETNGTAMALYLSGTLEPFIISPYFSDCQVGPPATAVISLKANHIQRREPCRVFLQLILEVDVCEQISIN